MKQLIEPSEAHRRIASHLPGIPAINCPLDKCAGRILREPIFADRPFPPFDRSMMDGFALRATETRTEKNLRITGRSTAGAPQTTLSRQPGSCSEIMTGAILPDGADCVIPYEATERISEEQVRVNDPEGVEAGDYVHRKGSDVKAGETILEPGRVLGSREIAAIASCGHAELAVSKMPSITIACSGDELVEVDQQPEPHQIRRSNDYSIETGLTCAHLSAARRLHLPDDREAAHRQLQELTQENDFVILSGGISMGQKDYLPGILDELGLECQFHGIAQKPGKPMGFWSHPRCSVFALPGNPLSTLTCLHHYVIPAIFQAMGRSAPDTAAGIEMTEAVSLPKHLTVFLPVNLLDGNKATACPPQNSGDLVRILESDGYIEVPAGEGTTRAGRTYPFRPWH